MERAEFLFVFIHEMKLQRVSQPGTFAVAHTGQAGQPPVTPPPSIHTEIIEDIPGTGETGESGQGSCARPASDASPPSQEREAYRKLSLTKQVLAAHTQKEEQAFLHRFRKLCGLSSLKANCSPVSVYLERQRQQATSNGRSTGGRAGRQADAWCVFTIATDRQTVFPLLITALLFPLMLERHDSE